MITRKLLICALLALSLPAAADFRTISRAYEVALSDVRVPATLSSGVMFRSCGNCDMMTVRTTPATQFIVNGQPVTLKEFRKSVFQIRDRAEKVVIVKHHLESNTIEYLSIQV